MVSASATGGHSIDLDADLATGHASETLLLLPFETGRQVGDSVGTQIFMASFTRDEDSGEARDLAVLGLPVGEEIHGAYRRWVQATT